MSNTHRDFVLKLIPKQSIGAEIGVYRGNFSSRILTVVKPKVLHLIDPWEYFDDPVYVDALYGRRHGRNQERMDSIYEKVKTRFAFQITSGRVIVHRHYSMSVIDFFQDDYFDWIYIDGNHQYEFVKNDLQGYYEKVKPGGLILGDDYGRVGWWNNEVEKAVAQFIRTHPVQIVCIHRYQFCLRKPL